MKEEMLQLIKDMEDIRGNLTDMEITLSQVGANVYKCREETRKIRLSVPTVEQLDRMHTKLQKDLPSTELVLMRDRLRRKKDQINASVQKMRDKMSCHLPQKPSSIPHTLLWTMLFLSVVSGVLLFLKNGPYRKGCSFLSTSKSTAS